MSFNIHPTVTHFASLNTISVKNIYDVENRSKIVSSDILTERWLLLTYSALAIRVFKKESTDGALNLK